MPVPVCLFVWTAQFGGVFCRGTLFVGSRQEDNHPFLSTSNLRLNLFFGLVGKTRHYVDTSFFLMVLGLFSKNGGGGVSQSFNTS